MLYFKWKADCTEAWKGIYLYTKEDMKPDRKVVNCVLVCFHARTDQEVL